MARKIYDDDDFNLDDDDFGDDVSNSKMNSTPSSFLSEYKSNRVNEAKIKKHNDLLKSIDDLSFEMKMTRNEYAKKPTTGLPSEAFLNNVSKKSSSTASNRQMVNLQRSMHEGMMELNTGIYELNKNVEIMGDASNDMHESVDRLSNVTYEHSSRLKNISHDLKEITTGISMMIPGFVRGAGKAAWGATKVGAKVAAAPVAVPGRAAWELGTLASRTEPAAAFGEDMREYVSSLKNQVGMMMLGGPIGSYIGGGAVNVVGGGAKRGLDATGRGVRRVGEVGYESGRRVAGGVRSGASGVRNRLSNRGSSRGGSFDDGMLYNKTGGFDPSEFSKDIEREADKGLYHVTGKGEIVGPKESVSVTKAKGTVGGSNNAIVLSIGSNDFSEYFGDDGGPFVTNLVTAMKKVFYDAKTGVLGLFGTPQGIRMMIGYALPIFGLGYRSELPNIRRIGIMAGMYRVLSMLYVHSRFASNEINDLMMNQTGIMMKAFGIEGSPERPKSRGLAEMLGGVLNRQLTNAFSGPTGPFTYLKEMFMGGMNKGANKSNDFISNLLGLNKEDGGILGTLIPGFSEWKKKKTEQEELGQSPTLVKRMSLFMSMNEHLENIRQILANSWMINWFKGSKSAKINPKKGGGDIPKLSAEGLITQDGLAEVHQGEAIIKEKTFGSWIGRGIAYGMEQASKLKEKIKNKRSVGETAVEEKEDGGKKPGFFGRIFGGIGKLFAEGGLLGGIGKWFKTVKEALVGIYHGITGKELTEGAVAKEKSEGLVARIYTFFIDAFKAGFNKITNNIPDIIKNIWDGTQQYNAGIAPEDLEQIQRKKRKELAKEKLGLGGYIGKKLTKEDAAEVDSLVSSYMQQVKSGQIEEYKDKEMMKDRNIFFRIFKMPVDLATEAIDSLRGKVVSLSRTMQDSIPDESTFRGRMIKIYQQIIPDSISEALFGKYGADGKPIDNKSGLLGHVVGALNHLKDAIEKISGGIGSFTGSIVEYAQVIKKELEDIWGEAGSDKGFFSKLGDTLWSIIANLKIILKGTGELVSSVFSSWMSWWGVTSEQFMAQKSIAGLKKEALDSIGKKTMSDNFFAIYKNITNVMYKMAIASFDSITNLFDTWIEDEFKNPNLQGITSSKAIYKTAMEDHGGGLKGKFIGISSGIGRMLYVGVKPYIDIVKSLVGDILGLSEHIAKDYGKKTGNRGFFGRIIDIMVEFKNDIVISIGKIATFAGDIAKGIRDIASIAATGKTYHERKMESFQDRIGMGMEGMAPEGLYGGEFHTGGIVGKKGGFIVADQGTIAEDEVFIKAKKGEVVLPTHDKGFLKRFNETIADALAKVMKKSESKRYDEIVSRLDTIISLLAGEKFGNAMVFPQKSIFYRMVETMVNLPISIAGTISEALVKVGGVLIEVPIKIIGTITHQVTKILNQALQLPIAIWNATLSGIRVIGKTVNTMYDTLAFGLKLTKDTIKGIAGAVAASIKLGLTSFKNLILSPFRWLGNMITKPFRMISEKLSAIADWFKNKTKGVQKAAMSLIGKHVVAVDQNNKLVYASWPGTMIKHLKEISSNTHLSNKYDQEDAKAKKKEKKGSIWSNLAAKRKEKKHKGSDLFNQLTDPSLGMLAAGGAAISGIVASMLGLSDTAVVKAIAGGGVGSTIGAIAGLFLGGIPGVFIGATLGTLIGAMGAQVIDPEAMLKRYQENPYTNGLITSFGGIVGSIIGFKIGGLQGAMAGGAIGAILGDYTAQKISQVSEWVGNSVARTTGMSIGAVAGGVIGFMVGGPVGMAVGAAVGSGVGLAGGMLFDQFSKAWESSKKAFMEGGLIGIFNLFTDTVYDVFSKISNFFSFIPDVIGKIPVIGPVMRDAIRGTLKDESGDAITRKEFALRMADQIPVLGTIIKPLIHTAFGGAEMLGDSVSVMYGKMTPYEFSMKIAESIPVVGSFIAGVIDKAYGVPIDSKGGTLKDLSVGHIARIFLEQGLPFGGAGTKVADVIGLPKMPGDVTASPQYANLDTSTENLTPHVQSKINERLQIAEANIQKKLASGEIDKKQASQMMADSTARIVSSEKRVSAREQGGPSTYTQVKDFKKTSLFKSLSRQSIHYPTFVRNDFSQRRFIPYFDNDVSLATKTTSFADTNLGFWDSVKAMVKQHEGLRLHRYIDTMGHPTIGYGHLIKPDELPYLNSITKDQADQLFEQDFKHHVDLARQIPGFDELDPVRQAALIDMTFNMGRGGVMKFEKFLGALGEGDYDTASRELLNSQYASQVKGRSRTIAKLIKYGDKSGILTGGTLPSTAEVDASKGFLAKAGETISGAKSWISGKLTGSTWPPTDGRLTSKYGLRPPVPGVPGASRMHKGIDIGPPVPGTEGTPIRSVLPGTVVDATVMRGYGNIVTIAHPDGKETRYAHLAGYNVNKGDQISAGQVIGSMGKTGLPGMSPHLHFEVRKNGEPLDPEQVFGSLPARGTQITAGRQSSGGIFKDVGSAISGAANKLIPSEQGGPVVPTAQLARNYAMNKESEHSLSDNSEDIKKFMEKISESGNSVRNAIVQGFDRSIRVMSTTKNQTVNIMGGEGQGGQIDADVESIKNILRGNL